MTQLARELKGRLVSKAARGWYPGAFFGAVYLVISLWFVWSSDGSLPFRITATVLLLLIGAVFVMLPPLVWGRGRVACYLALLGLALLVCLLFPFVGVYAVWLFIYISCASAAIFGRGVDVLIWITATALAQLVIVVAVDQLAQQWYAVLLDASIATMMLGITQLARTNRRLKDAQSEIARLAVVEERARFSRDMHDVLGHSLTVVTVKSELAVRLVDRDPERAKAEIADIERLSRAALTDLRASVAGYREMSLDTELAAARAALAAAEVRAAVPVSGECVDPALRELFAWVVREAVTNVLRHARAESCEIVLAASSMRVVDDGVGMLVPVLTGAEGATDAARGISSARGTGLAGLAERITAAGALLAVEPGRERGTVVTVSLTPGREASRG
ncbi:MAG TPA: histidine kinase [Gryllotalpicola sp.]